MIQPPAEWNDTHVNYPLDERLHLLIAKRAQQSPKTVALQYGNVTLTHEELNQRANQLARHLRERGVKPNTLVGISAFRSIEMVVGLLGILKAGGAYVPIDPEYPADRIAFMLADSGVQILLTQEQVKAVLPPTAAQLICLDSEWPAIATHASTDLVDETTSTDLAYMIYTSGSTGKPKGALNSHRGICNRLLWMQDRYVLSSSDTVLQKTPFSFDVSVWEFFWPLLAGSRLVVAKPGGHQDPLYLAKLIQQEHITVLHFVPSMLRTFLTEPAATGCTSLRHVICSGEALTFDLQEKFFALLPCELHNLYGPTEAAVDVTHWTCRRDSQSPIVPIGRPVANTRMYVLDEKLRQVPVGAEGELHIGGVQVGRGYHNRPELTAEKFIPDPFSPDQADRLYKTGDLARWMDDGNIEYLGRLDFQVKLRGFRIELGEIENALGLHPAVRQAVVVALDEPDRDKRLVAYITARHAQHTTVTELREHLLARLPEYMVPALFVWLDAIPLSPNGKVDRRALPAPSTARPELAQPYTAATTEMERRLVALWQEILHIDPIGTDDRFFELGGDSLGIAVAHGKLQTILAREFPITTLFEFITIRTLAAHLAPAAPNANTTNSIQDRARRQREAQAARRIGRPS
ncbi:MAG: amino acid adenylation domain-containing protein [Verrucomicrobia bacterium]|nr:amino acid adenylation domain-containing protein [Verrucomicrobiota bacterium]